MIDHDRLFKELFSTFFVEFIELFLPDVMAYLEPDSVTFLDKEVFTDVTAGERYEADLLVQAQFRGEPSCFLIHVENQAKAQANFGYWFDRHEKRGLIAIILRQLKHQVGELEEEVKAQVRELEVAQLEELSEALLDFEDAQNLTDWLRNLERRGLG